MKGNSENVGISSVSLQKNRCNHKKHFSFSELPYKSLFLRADFLLEMAPETLMSSVTE